MDEDTLRTLRLGGQRALLGNVPASLRAVSVEAENKQLSFRCYFDAAVSSADKELLSDAAGELLGDFSAEWSLLEEALVVRAPESMTHLQHLIFLRHEAPSSNE